MTAAYDFATSSGGRREPLLLVLIRRVGDDPAALFFIAAILAVTFATLWRGPFAGWRDTFAVAVPWVVGSLAIGLPLGKWIRSAGTRAGTVLRSAFLMAILSVVASCVTSIYRWWYGIVQDHRQIPFDWVAVATASLRECLTPKFGLIAWLAATLGALVGAIVARRAIGSPRPSLERVVAMSATVLTLIVLMAADFTYQGPYLRHFVASRFAQARSLAGQPEASVAAVMGPATWTDQHWDQVMSGSLQPAPGATFLTVYNYAPYPIREGLLRWLASSDRIVIACAGGWVVRVGCSVRVRFVDGKVFPECAVAS